MSSKDVLDLVQPHPDDVANTIAWLQGSTRRAVTLETMNGDFVSVHVTVAEAESLLEAEYYEFSHLSSGKTSIRLASGYNVPSHMVHAIDFVSPTTRFPAISKLQIAPKKSQFLRNATPNALFNTPKNLWYIRSLVIYI